MHHRVITAIGVLALTAAAAGCNRQPTVERGGAAATSAARDADRIAEFQRQREQDVSKLNERIAAIEHEYQEKRASRATGTTGTTAQATLRGEVKSDVDDLRQAVRNLETTTPENWWDRHQAALTTAVRDVESDVRRFAGTRALPAAPASRRVDDGSGQTVSAEPFMSGRDKFVADMRSRVDAIGSALDRVKASGRRKAELDDLHARVNKMSDDIDRLKSASPEDWWALSKHRVEDYIGRVEKSVGRVNDDRH